MSNNPFLEFTPEELKAFEPFISKLNKYYNIHGIELDFERAREGSLEDILAQLNEAEKHCLDEELGFSIFDVIMAFKDFLTIYTKR